jgi:hypothetical protein
LCAFYFWLHLPINPRNSDLMAYQRFSFFDLPVKNTQGLPVKSPTNGPFAPCITAILFFSSETYFFQSVFFRKQHSPKLSHHI